VADEYDEDLAGHPLFDFDEEVLSRHLHQPGLVIDFGCGTGRTVVPLAKRGFQTLAVDLSPQMLERVGAKAAGEGVRVDRVCANLVELDCLADGIADYAVCLFSTFGMIRGRENRHKILTHARRILKPDGLFILHAHNLWQNLWTSPGRRWVVRHLWEAARKKDVELGDKFFDYRGIPQVYLHVFRKRELLRAIRAAGLKVRELITLEISGCQPLRHPWFFGRLRAYGWIAVCERAADI